MKTRVVLGEVMKEPQPEIFCAWNESVLNETADVSEHEAKLNYDNDPYCCYKHLAVPRGRVRRPIFYGALNCALGFQRRAVHGYSSRTMQFSFNFELDSHHSLGDLNVSYSVQRDF